MQNGICTERFVRFRKLKRPQGGTNLVEMCSLEKFLGDIICRLEQIALNLALSNLEFIFSMIKNPYEILCVYINRDSMGLSHMKKESRKLEENQIHGCCFHVNKYRIL